MRLRWPWRRHALYRAIVCGAAIAAWKQDHHEGKTMVTFLDDADMPQPVWSELTDNAPAFLDWAHLFVPPEAVLAVVSGHLGNTASAALLDRKGRLSMASTDGDDVRFVVNVEIGPDDVAVLGSFLHAFDGVA